MLNKHFFKTLVGFFGIILFGMGILYTIDYLDKGNKFEANVVKNNPLTQNKDK